MPDKTKNSEGLIRLAATKWLSRLRAVDARIMNQAKVDRRVVHDWVFELRHEQITKADLLLTAMMTLLVTAFIWAIVVPNSSNSEPHVPAEIPIPIPYLT